MIKYYKETMLSYCLKCKKKNTESINPKVSKTCNSKTIIYHNVLYVAAKNQNLLKSNKQKGY